MDIPAIIGWLPLDIRVEVRRALQVLEANKVFELIQQEAEKEILQAATVLAHIREYEQMERVSIRAAGYSELFRGLTEASKEN